MLNNPKNILVLGMGEIGQAVSKVLTKNLNTTIYGKDIDPKDSLPDKFEVMHVCLRFSEEFIDIVNFYTKQYQVALVVIHSTVPPGTTAQCMHAVHVPIRGRHSNLEDAISTFHLFVGYSAMPCPLIELIKAYFITAFRVKHVFLHTPPETTELAKLINLAQYGLNIEFSRYIKKCCEKFGVTIKSLNDFTYARNYGLVKLEGTNKLHLPILDPLDHDAVIGGHCVLPAMQILNNIEPSDLLGNIILNNAEKAARKKQEGEGAWNRAHQMLKDNLIREVEEKQEKKPEDSSNIFWQPCNIYPSAKFGKQNSVGMFSEIGHNVIIGDYNRIGCSVFIPEGVTIGNNCFIGPHVVFTNDKKPPSGKENWAHTTVENFTSIGANATILPGVKLGQGCMIGAGAVVTGNVEPSETVAGVPARGLSSKLPINSIRPRIGDEA